MIAHVGTSPRVLLIEDDDILANLLQAKLEQSGCIVDLVKDGEDGLKSLLDAARQKTDVVLLDMVRPSRSGLDILEALHKEHMIPALPVIVVSNSGQPVDIERAKKLGVRDWLVKAEIEPDEILAKVKSVASEMKKEPDRRTEQAAGGSTTPVKTPESEKRQAADTPHPSKTILLIEDDPMISFMLEQKLAAKHYRIAKAVSEPEIDAILEERTVSLILLDILLPDLNGLMILKKVKEDSRYRGIPVVIISNLGQREDIERGLAGGAVDYIIKANTLPDEIVKKVEKLLQPH